MRDIITKLEEMNVEKPQLNEGLGDMAHEAEMDHEVQMARSDLYKTAKYAVAIHKMMKDVSEMEGVDGWVAAKITKAADYLSAVKHHMEGEMMADVELAVVPVAGDMTDAMTMPQESVEVAEAMTKVTDIKWDADDEEDVKDLSTTMMVPVPSGMDKEEAEDFIADYITDKTGFTHGGFKIAEAEQVEEEDVIGDIIAKLPKQSKAPGYTKSDSDRMAKLVKQVDRVSQPSSPAPKGPKISAVTKQKQANAAAKMQTQSKFSEWSKK